MNCVDCGEDTAQVTLTGYCCLNCGASSPFLAAENREQNNV